MKYLVCSIVALFVGGSVAAAIDHSPIWTKVNHMPAVSAVANAWQPVRLAEPPHAPKVQQPATYAAGYNASKVANKPLVTFVGGATPWFDDRFVTCAIDSLPGFSGECVLVSRWVGDKLLGYRIKESDTADAALVALKALDTYNAQCPGGICSPAQGGCPNGACPATQGNCPGGVCRPAAVPQRVPVQGNCPGGVCPPATRVPAFQVFPSQSCPNGRCPR